MASALFERVRVGVRGGGDLASGVIFRLHRAGFPVVVTELAAPLFVRRTVSFGEAVYSGSLTIESVTTQLVDSVAEISSAWANEIVPVIIDPAGDLLPAMPNIAVVVDARMAKVNLGTTLPDGALLIALGPGFTAGVDCHAVIETNRGHHLGRVLYTGAAEPDTGMPGEVQNQTHTRVLRAPIDGYVQPKAAIAERIEVGQLIATVGDQPIIAPFSGVLRGLIHEQVPVTVGMKIGDLDPRARPEHCFTISDKSLAIGGGVLEAVLAAPSIRSLLLS